MEEDWKHPKAGHEHLGPIPEAVAAKAEGKTVSTVFHLSNKEAKRELDVYINTRCLNLQPTATYLVSSLTGHSPRHTSLLDVSLNCNLRIITGCSQPTPVEQLPVLEDIPPAELRRGAASLALARCAMDPDHLFHYTITGKRHNLD